MHGNGTELDMAANAQPLTAPSDQPIILRIPDSDIKTQLACSGAEGPGFRLSDEREHFCRVLGAKLHNS
jgi:hypothetical protein